MSLRIYRRPGNPNWYLRGTVARQGVYETTGTDDKAAAEALRIRREAEILDRAVHGRRATVTFAQAAVTYVESGGERRFLPRLARYFGPDKLVRDIDADTVNACARALFPHAAPATVNRQVITPIAAIVNLEAETNGYTPRRFRRRREPRARQRWLTPAEAEALIGAAGDVAQGATRLIVLTLLGTGLRAGELTAIERQHLHLGSAEAYVADSKTGAARMVWFPRRTAAALEAAQLPEAGAVFRTPRGAPYARQAGRGGPFRRAFNTARDRAGLGDDVTPHVCRHTWATWFYAATRDFGRLMDLGGWVRADTANRYRKIAPVWLPQALLDHGWDFGGRENLTVERRRA